MAIGQYTYGFSNGLGVVEVIIALLVWLILSIAG